MHCTQCGQELAEGSAFCPNCGAPIGAMPPQSESTAQPTADPIPEVYAQQQDSWQQENAYQNPQPQGAYQQQYQQQPQQPPYQPYQGTPTVKSTAYLVWSILVTLFCCLPFGIPAIVFAAKISSCNERGDYPGAEEAARKAKIWTIVSAVVGFVLLLVLVVIYGSLIISMINSGDFQTGSFGFLRTLLH